MMGIRRVISAILALLLIMPLASCGKSDDIVIVPQTRESLPIPSYTTAEPPAAPEGDVFINGTDGIDVDITVLSSTMVYSVVYCMLMSPIEYKGLTVRINGSFSYYHDEMTGNDYYACVIQDATACCSQGLEFRLQDADQRVYPDDYPEPGEEIVVTGVFDTYSENGFTYCVLEDASFE